MGRTELTGEERHTIARLAHAGCLAALREWLRRVPNLLGHCGVVSRPDRDHSLLLTL